MQVALENLEPGSIVETPEALVKVGYEDSGAVYIGTNCGWPQFFAKYMSSGVWGRASWPYGSDPMQSNYGQYIKVPPGFKVTKSKEAAQAFTGSLKGTTIPSVAYASGCDPEMFVMDKKGKVIPARRVLPKKGNSLRFYDGVQAEFCPQAGGCLEALGTQIRSQLALLASDFRMKYPNSKLSMVNSIQFTQAEMDKLEDEDVAFRCSESMNVYGDIPGVQEPRGYLWRFAGGHIHVGPGNPAKPAPVLKNMVRAMDGVLGVAGVSLARMWDNPERRRNYGRAGEFRLPAHGLEYRVLSNYWLCSPLIYHLTFEIARWAYKLGEMGLFNAVWQGGEDETRDCINNCDVPLAQEIIKRNSGVYNKLFEDRWKGYGTRHVKKAMDTLMNGVDVVVKDPTDIAGNWQFDNSNWGAYGGDEKNSKWRNLR